MKVYVLMTDSHCDGSTVFAVTTDAAKAEQWEKRESEHSWEYYTAVECELDEE